MSDEELAQIEQRCLAAQVDQVGTLSFNALLESARDVPALAVVVRRLRELAGSFYRDMGHEMTDYMFCKHYWSDMEEHPWLAAYNPYPEGSPYFKYTQKAQEPAAEPSAGAGVEEKP